jgi:hypothetical protein
LRGWLVRTGAGLAMMDDLSRPMCQTPSVRLGDDSERSKR